MQKEKMNILIACEESQRVCTAFRKRGHNAFSCDVIPCSGGHPEWHIQADVLPLLNGRCQFQTMDGAIHKLDDRWDLIIAHPPCTYLTVTGNRWFNVEKYGEKAIQRMKDREEAIVFFMAFVNADCDKIAIENPLGVMSSVYRKPDQTVHPYWFGDPFEKRTCWWLKGLPLLVPTDMVEPPQRQMLPSGKTMPSWYSKKYSRDNPEGESRQSMRSKTFPGMADAIADQWG